MTRENKIIATSLVGVIANVMLATGKGIVGFVTGSISIISDALNNFTDILSSLVTIVGTKIANKKPDKEHPFGHGRVEYITSLIIAIIIMFAGANAIYESIRSLINHSEAIYDNTTLIIISIAVFVKILLGIFFKKMGKSTNSDALSSSGTDALFDALLSTSTLVGALVSMFAGLSLEGYLGILIGLFIIKGAIDILRSAISNIVGERTKGELARAIKAEVLTHEEVLGVYDLIINNYGPNNSIGSFHIEVDEKMPASRIHPLTKHIAEDIYLKFGAIVTIGIYASNSSHPEIKAIRDFVEKEVEKYKSIKELHGFYVDINKKVISFDLLFFFTKEDVLKIKNTIEEEIKNKYPDYSLNIIIDSDFSD